MKRTTSAIVLGVLLASGSPALLTASDPLLEEARKLFEPIPLQPPAEIAGQKVTPPQIELGAKLYFDPRLSEAHNISCNTCHQIGLGGADGRSTSIGHNWQRGGRNAPTVLNAVFNTAQFWDGRAGDLKEQAGGPIVNPIEMGTSREHAVEQIRSIPGYRPLFEKAFPGTDEPITYDNIAFAIAAFETTLITPNAPFDRFLRGETNALDARQKEGLRLFIDKGCATCHQGVNLGGNMYAPFGVVQRPGWEILPPDDKGRYQVTKTVDDQYVFKVPGLRNIALTAPYFHSGQAWDLAQAVAIMGSAQLGAELTEEEARTIAAFLESLTGELPAVVYPALPPSTARTTRPQP